MAPDLQQEKDYWSLIESTQRLYYPGFVDQLSGQEGPLGEEGRAAVIEFQDGAKPSARRLQTSRDLRRYLEKPSPTGAVIGRAFILEGLPRRFVQILGSKLRVSPSFFAAHWA